MNWQTSEIPLLSRGGVARSAGVVLVKKFDGIWPTPPRLRVLRKLRDFILYRASTPPLLRRGISLCAEHVRQFGGESPLPNLMEVKG